jgi:hypothetical protein
MLVLAVVDLCVATGVALVIDRFGVWSVNDSNPPHCFNYFGGELDCSLESPMRAAAFASFVIVLLALLTLHAVRGRRLRG